MARRVRVDLEARERISRVVQTVERSLSGLARTVSQTVTRAFDKAAGATRRFGERLRDDISSRFVITLGDITNALRAVGRAFTSTIAAAERQAAAVQTANAAMRAAGTFSDAASRNVQQFASELQAVTTVGDEAALELFALARSFSDTNEAAQETVRVAADFAAGAGLNLEEAVRRIGRGARGSTEDIAKFVPEIAKLSKEQLRAGEATRLLGERFAGLAAAQAETAEGLRTQVGNALGDVVEGLGLAVTESNLYRDALRFVRDEATLVADVLRASAGVQTEEAIATRAATDAQQRRAEAVRAVAQAEASLQQAIDFGLGERDRAPLVRVLTAAQLELGESTKQVAATQKTLKAELDGTSEALRAQEDAANATAKADREYAAALNKLGLDTTEQARAKIAALTEVVAQAEARFHSGAISSERFAQIQAKAADEANRLRQALTEEEQSALRLDQTFQSTADSQTDLIDTNTRFAESTTTVIEAQTALRNSLAATQSGFRLTEQTAASLVSALERIAEASQFSTDPSLDSANRLTAPRTTQGGRRIQLPGGGSRLAFKNPRSLANIRRGSTGR